MIVYVHGMGQHRRAEKAQWDRALFGADAPDAEMAFYSDILHPADTPASFAEPLRKELFGNADRIVRQRMISDPFNRTVLRHVSMWLIEDVYAYFYKQEQRDAIHQRVKFLLDLYVATGDRQPLIVIGHSLGSIVAYEVLCLFTYAVDCLITLGSPLGIEVVKSELRKHHGERLSIPGGVKRWLNCADRFDVVAIDKTLRDDYRGDGITDIEVVNPNRLEKNQGAHSGIGYLSTREVRESVAVALGG